MDILWILLAGLFLIAGIIGCIVPLLPGPPLAYMGFLFVQLKADPPFTLRFMLIWAGIVVAVSLLDYLIPVYGTKKFGGTKYGMWGCMIGLFAGIWLGPWGIILGPFFGALLGEMINSNHTGAFKAALGSFVGFLFSTLLKLIVCVIMCWYFVMALW
jgi:uncharacterized protein YqgC (DUF456 family)